MKDQKTIVALATPKGEGAIGIIRLSGESAIDIANSIFFGKDLKKVKGHTVHFGSIREKDLIIDEVLATVFVGPKSYTRENIVEFSCHGSAYILQKIISLCLSFGARMADPGEFTLRAFLNGALDLSQAEAVADLIASKSESSHALAMKQLRGNFSKKISLLREELITFAALIELELDFGEEDVEFANKEQLRNLVSTIQSNIQELLSSFEWGNVIKEGVPVVISGKPNVGKSTLLNLLLNDDRAIVSDIPGTTRDTIEDEINIKGVRFRFIDTAGIRETADIIENLGVERAYEEIKKAAIVLHLFDARETDENSALKVDESYRKLLSGAKSHIIHCANKIDLKEVSDLVTNMDRLSPIPLSAKNNQGTSELIDALLEHSSLPENLEDTIVTNARHAHALKESLDSLERVQNGLQANVSGDLLAADIRMSLEYLGRITGEVNNEDLLDHIFSKFCIGK